MSVNKRLIYSCLILLPLAVTALSQNPPAAPRPPRTNDPNRQDAATRRWYEELQRRENAPTGIGSIRDTNETLIAKLKNKALEKLEPSEEEKKPFAEFLKQPGTGLIKLAVETDCTKILDIANPDKECLNFYIPGKAKAYSFRKENYAHRAYADLERSSGMFVAPGTFVLGLMADLKDTPIETVALSDENVSMLSNFAPATEIENIIKQEKIISSGLALGNLIYRKALPIKENATYLLRSIGYQAKFKNLPKSNAKKVELDDDRSDVIVVFKVVRKNPDDSLLLLWKELRRKDAPKIEVDLARR